MAKSKRPTAAERRRREASHLSLYPPNELLKSADYRAGITAGGYLAETAGEFGVDYVIGVADGVQGRLNLGQLEDLVKRKNI